MLLNKTNPKRFDPASHYAGAMQAPPADTHHVKRRYQEIPYARLSFSQALDIYLPDEGEGVRVKAFISLQPDTRLSIIALKRFCSENLPI